MTAETHRTPLQYSRLAQQTFGNGGTDQRPEFGDLGPSNQQQRKDAFQHIAIPGK